MIWGRTFDASNPVYGFVDGDTPELCVAVKEPYRNLGIGASLMRALAEQYSKMGVFAISLSVDKAYRARHLYGSGGSGRRHGYHHEEDVARARLALSSVPVSTFHPEGCVSFSEGFPCRITADAWDTGSGQHFGTIIDFLS